MNSLADDRSRLAAKIQAVVQGEDAAAVLDVALDLASHCIGIIAENGNIADSLLEESQIKMANTLRREWSRLQVLRQQALSKETP